MNGQLQADAAVLQERDSFTGTGWTKVLAPAKVNLRLAIGARRLDGYHNAVSIMHALALHDVVYLRRMPGTPAVPGEDLPVKITMVGCGDVEAPEVPPEKNIAVRAVRALVVALAGKGEEASAAIDSGIEIRIEKNIPSEAGLGGGSSDAAAVLAGLARLWHLESADGNAMLESVARSLGADVAFFLRGGCAYLDGVGDCFSHALEPRRESVVLVKPAGGVSTAAAYTTFDQLPQLAESVAASQAQAQAARTANEIELFNNLAVAAESLMPELADIRSWLESQPGVVGALLSGSGSATFAVCDSFDAACRIVAAARTRGFWARTTAFSSIRATVC